jgi:hypothetical protein
MDAAGILVNVELLGYDNTYSLCHWQTAQWLN